MSGTVNKVILVGRIGKDPEYKTLPNGTPIVSLSMATDETYTKDGTKHQNTEWHNLVAFAKLADAISQHVGKGCRMYVEGKIKTRSWDDRDGNKKYRTEIVCSTATFIDFKDNRDPASTPPTNQPSFDDDLPFG